MSIFDNIQDHISNKSHDAIFELNSKYDWDEWDKDKSEGKA